MLKNSFVKFEIIEKYPFEYQCLLESIGDYLIHQPFWKETNDGIEFFDVTSPHTITKTVHHFRSFNLKSERKFVSQCWNQCLDNPDITIPAKVIKIDDDGKLRKLHTLKHFKSNETDTSSSFNPSTSLKKNSKPLESFN